MRAPYPHSYPVLGALTDVYSGVRMAKLEIQIYKPVDDETQQP